MLPEIALRRTKPYQKQHPQRLPGRSPHWPRTALIPRPAPRRTTVRHHPLAIGRTLGRHVTACVTDRFPPAGEATRNSRGDRFSCLLFTAHDRLHIGNLE